jgi:hypothetical protein
MVVACLAVFILHVHELPPVVALRVGGRGEISSHTALE